MPNKKVTLIRPRDGKAVTVDEEFEDSLRSLGYTDESALESVQRVTSEAEKEYYESTGQQVLAGIEGGLAGITVGLSDVGATDESRKRAAYNPGTRLATELVGAIGTAILSGGTTAEASAGRLVGQGVRRGILRDAAGLTPVGLLDRAGVAVARGVGGGARGALTRGAVEGALTGVGSTISQASLANDDLTVEAILAGAGLGGFFGSGLGMLGYGVEQGATKLGSRIKSATEASMSDTAGALGLTSKAMPFSAAPKLKAGSAKLRGADGIDELTEHVLSSQSFDKLRSAVKDTDYIARHVVKDIESKVGKSDIRLNFEEAKQLGDDIIAQAFVGKLRGVKTGKEVRELREAYRIASKVVDSDDSKVALLALNEYKGTVARLAKKFGIKTEIPALKASSNEIIEQSLEYRQFAATLKGFPKTPSAFLNMSDSRAEELFASLDKVFAGNAPELIPAKTALNAAVEDIARAVGVSSQGKSPVAVLQQARDVAIGARASRYNDVRNLMRIIDEGPKAQTKVSPFAKELPPKGPWKRSTSAIQKWLQSSTRTTAARSAYNIVKAKTGSVAAGALAHSGAGIVASTLFATGQNELGLAVAAEMSGARAKTMAAIAKAVAKWGPSVGRGIQKAAPRTTILSKNLNGEEEDGDKPSFEERSREIRRLAASAQDRGYLTSQLLSRVGHGDFALAANNKAFQILGVLAKALPRDKGRTPWGLDSLWKVPAEAEEVFARIYRGTWFPLESIEALSSGDVHPAEVRALEEAWPTIFANWKIQMLEKLAQPGIQEKLTPQDLTELSVMLRTKLSPFARPEFVTAQQAMFMNPPAKVTPGPQGNQGGSSVSTQPTTAQKLTER